MNADNRARLGQSVLGLGVALGLTVAGASVVPVSAAAPQGRAMKKASIVRPWMPQTAKLSGQPATLWSAPSPNAFRLVAADSDVPDLSSDGRFVVVFDFARNGIVVTDTQTGAIRQVTTDGKGRSPTISDDGRFVAYGWDNQTYQVYLADLQTGQTIRLSPGDSMSGGAQISADGSTVVFTSYRPTSGEEDWNLLSWDRATGISTNLTPGPGGGGESAVSTDGTAVAFSSRDRLADADTDDSDDVYLSKSGELTLVSDSEYRRHSPSISGDGSRVAYAGGGYWHPGEGVSYSNVYVWTAPTATTPATTTAITTNVDGPTRDDDAGDPHLSGNGRYVTYIFRRSGMYQIFRDDLTTHTTQQITHGNYSSLSPAINHNGDTIAFYSSATDLVSNDPNGSTGDVYIWHG